MAMSGAGMLSRILAYLVPLRLLSVRLVKHRSDGLALE